MHDDASAPSDDPTRWCPRCERGMPASKCRSVALGERSAHVTLLCGACGGVTRAVDVIERVSLGELYRGALRYPFADGHGSGVVALGAACWFVTKLPLAGTLVAMAIVTTYLLSVVQRTALGHDDLPAPTDFVHWTDYLGPAARCVAAVSVGALPLAVLALAGPRMPHALWWTLLVPAALFFWAWAPGALAWASMTEGFFDAMRPAPVLALITRVPRDYALTVGVLWALAAAYGVALSLAMLAAHSVAAVPVLPGVFVGVVGVAIPMIMARIVGLLLRARRMDIGMDE